MRYGDEIMVDEITGETRSRNALDNVVDSYLNSGYRGWINPEGNRASLCKTRRWWFWGSLAASFLVFPVGPFLWWVLEVGDWMDRRAEMYLRYDGAVINYGEVVSPPP